MSYLPFITDENLQAEVRHILSVAADALRTGQENSSKNVTDPFSIVFEMSGFKLPSITDWQAREKQRQAQKTLSNSFGLFHQNILGHVDGWKNLKTGQSADLVCQDRKLIAEIKNKYNTVSGGQQSTIYDHLKQLVMPISSEYKGYTSFYVETIPKPSKNQSRYNVPFTPSDRKISARLPSNSLIRKIDGQSFYDLVTGETDALRKLYEILPSVITELTGYKYDDSDKSALTLYFKKAFN